MSQTIIHIGAPRTGTTVIQKSLLKKAKKHIILTKKPFSSSSGGATRREQIASTRKLLDIQNPSEINNHNIELFNMLYICCRETASASPNPHCQEALNHIATVLSKSSSTVVIYLKDLQTHMHLLIAFQIMLLIEQLPPLAPPMQINYGCPYPTTDISLSSRASWISKIQVPQNGNAEKINTGKRLKSKRVYK